jgi:hypothetical protein
MKITRDGKTYELTMNELSLAYNEVLHQNWRIGIADAIERNCENLNFGLDYTMDEFIDECVDKIEEGYYDEDEEEKYDEILFDMAESLDVWEDDDDE